MCIVRHQNNHREDEKIAIETKNMYAKDFREVNEATIT